ncbi:MAG: hypothetical protein ATN35_07025 [Epulopiscium sp. Nele67-Bin004]|nr:MAG: hypothetical protein ATN35_07025 [Epulopiscium sp. Nele67-Bin004]
MRRVQKEIVLTLMIGVCFILIGMAHVKGQSIEQSYTYVVNYYRPHQDYMNWDLIVWDDENDTINYSFEEQKEFMTSAKTYMFKQVVHKSTSPKLNFLVEQPNLNKQEGGNRYILMPEGEVLVQVWLVAGDSEVYYQLGDISFDEHITNAFAESSSTLLVSSNVDIEDLLSFYVVDTKGNQYNGIGEHVQNMHYKVTLTDGVMQANEVYRIGAENVGETVVKMRNILDEYIYNGKLGMIYGYPNANEITFRTWAPTAKQVNIVIFDNAFTETLIKFPMHSIAGTGAWEIALPNNNAELVDHYYMYQIECADGNTELVVDPYAISTSANSTRTAIIDISTTNPPEWETDISPTHTSKADAIIYETHIRDLSIDTDANFTNLRGTFRAFAETGITTEDGHSVGIDHIKELGVTDVNLMPIYDFGTIDETMVEDPTYTGQKYNWGYSPKSFNVPEGGYSTTPTDPNSRIFELKEMIATLHNNGLRAIMDVNYTHTDVEHPFKQIAPDYYYKTNDITGEYLDNEIATDRHMVRKFIVDSVSYWANEYHIDGFNFGHVGRIDKVTIKEIAKIPDIVVYGEDDEQSKLDDIANFNISGQKAILGETDDIEKGFATGEENKENAVMTTVKGSVNTFADSPFDVVNYVTSHNNLTLWDKVIKTQNLNDEEGLLNIKDGDQLNNDSDNMDLAVANTNTHHDVDTENPLENETVKRSLLANSIVLTSQGVPFIHGGEEMLRTKFGDQNSYSSPDSINQILWQTKDDFIDVFNYYKGLIELRKEHPAFRMTSKDMIEKHIEVMQTEDNIVSYRLKDNANDDSWSDIVVIYNGNRLDKEITLPYEANWHIVANGNSAGTNIIKSLSNVNSVTADGLAMTVLFAE